MRPKGRAFLFSLPLVAALAIGGACSRCGGDTAAAVDASVDAVADVRKDSHTEDVAAEADVPLDGEVVTSDWPGWRRIPDLRAFDCALDVAIDPTMVAPAIKWISCTDGRASCEEIDKSAFSPEVYFPNGWFSGDGRAFLLAHWVQSNIVGQFSIYDSKSLDPLIAWRIRYQTAPATFCDVNPQFTETKMGVAYLTSVDGGTIATSIDYDTPFGLMSAPSLVALPLIDDSSDFRISDSTFAFGTNLSTSIFRGVTGTTMEQRVVWPYQLIQPRVVHDDVYANNQHGMGDGWYGEAHIFADGGVGMIRAVPQRHVTAMATDGSDWYWAESYGSSNPDDSPQPTVEIYSAPYTNDAAILDATKKKLFTMPNGAFLPPNNAVAIQGHYVFSSIPGQTEVARASDGHHTSVLDQGTGWCERLLYASDSELWCIESLGQKGPSGVKVTKIHLSAW